MDNRWERKLPFLSSPEEIIIIIIIAALLLLLLLLLEQLSLPFCRCHVVLLCAELPSYNVCWVFTR